MTMPELEPRLTSEVEQLRAERCDTVPLGDIAEIVNSLSQSLAGDVWLGDPALRRELSDSIAHIRQATDASADTFDDADLLNGPARPNQANSQHDIDALFADSD